MTSREFSDRVRRRARRAGVHVPGALLEQLERYFRLLDTWNAKINLTALDLQRDPDNAVDRLLIEPLVAVRHLDSAAARVVDIGSGGGSPAIPMQLARPDAAFTLVESKTRKCAFLREAGRHLKIDLRVETARYEMLLSRPEFHEAFDALTMRAVRVEPGVLVSLQALLRPGGEFLLFRGPTSGGVASIVTPLLVPRGEFVLVESMQSRLLVLKKREIGAPPFRLRRTDIPLRRCRADVPRGTLIAGSWQQSAGSRQLAAGSYQPEAGSWRRSAGSRQLTDVS